jgi:diaminopimelate decarboxylase
MTMADLLPQKLPAFSLGGWTVPGYLESRNGHLTMDGVDLVAVARSRGTPLYVYSERRLRENARAMLAGFRALRPRTTLCYASKACSNLRVLHVLREEGVAIEVNSAGELFKASAAGFRPDQIVFNGVSKSRRDLAEGMSPPIKAINIDSLFEIERCIAVARELRTTANIALRIVPGLVSGTSPGNQTGSAATKFGILESELGQALALARGATDAIRVSGLHVHVGSQLTDPALYRRAAEVLADHTATAEAALGYPIEHVNIGGGFPVVYVKSAQESLDPGYFRTEVTSRDIAAAALPTLADRLGANKEIVIEPGRSMVSDTAVLLSTVEGVKDRGPTRWLYLDAGYNTLVESYTYKWYYHSLTANKTSDTELRRFRLAGPLCDNGDAFFDVDGEATVQRLIAELPELEAKRATLEKLLVRLPGYRELPASTAPGDLVAFLDTGAYTLDQMTPNNGRERAEVAIVTVAGAVETLRRRDSRLDLVMNEVL